MLTDVQGSWGVAMSPGLSNCSAHGVRATSLFYDDVRPLSIFADVKTPSAGSPLRDVPRRTQGVCALDIPVRHGTVDLQRFL